MKEVKIDNLFDLDDLSDLPKEYKSTVERSGVKADIFRLLKIFDYKNILNIKELMVAFYRIYKIDKPRIWFHSTLNNLTKLGRLKRIDAPLPTFELLNKEVQKNKPKKK